jgi:hypothetical protein
VRQWKTEGIDIEFEVAPALLQFHEVTDLRIALDYAKPSAGLTPFSLHRIVRSEHRYPNGHESYAWRLEVNWPEGEISFLSPGFTQTLRGPIVQSRAQTLSSAQRSAPAATGAAAPAVGASAEPKKGEPS